MGVMGCRAYFTLTRYILFYLKKNLKKSKKGLQPLQPMTLSCKSLILNKTNDNHSYLLFDIFYKKNLDIRVYPYTGDFYELVVYGAPGGRAGNGTLKG